ncbi:hypothetical protein BCR36DRAFT_321600 [Piromyces finnis]|uniref:C2H2-type domain-containing protein n=1 Tax=Piromyces finnis TaxID=1754191 RepID=A0A1Y1VHA0_9FUNG|nr:hypothetical protein BCR36DRAFT_321600 [Piromyces finnis]|eukprot:ORX55453.1 hypothetical protein BCR36DRAFT_321600 [Piromyces finnis]
MPLQKQASNTMPSRFKQNKPLISRQPLNKNEFRNDNLIINSLNKYNSKSENEMLKKELKLCSQVWMKLSKLPLIRYLEKKHNPNVHLDTKILNEITIIYEKINKEEYIGKDEFYSMIMDIINKFGLICKPTAQVYSDYTNLKVLFNSEWNKCLNILKLNKDIITSPDNKIDKLICTLCNEEFKTKKELKIHLKTCLINEQKVSIKDEDTDNSLTPSIKNKSVISHSSLSSPIPNIKYKYEKKDLQKSEKKELSISYKYYSRFFKPDFKMEDIKIGEVIDCPFNNCQNSSNSIAKLITHIMTNHQDKLTVISDYYCSICGKRLPDITTQLIHCVEHQYNKRRKIFSKDHTTSIFSSTTSLLNPLGTIQNPFIPINSTLPIPSSNTKSLSTKSLKLKRKYPFSIQDCNKLPINDGKIKEKENNLFPLTPSSTSSLSQTLTSPVKFNEKQLKENNTSLNISFKVKEGEKVKKLKTKDKEYNTLSEKSSDKLNKNISEKIQLQLGQSSDNTLQLKNTTSKTIDYKVLDGEKSSIKNISSQIFSPVDQKLSYKHTKESLLSSSSQSNKNKNSPNVSYTRLKSRIPCVVESCKKTYKNIKGLKTHISRYHPEVNVNIEELIESYKIHSEQEEIKKSNKVQNNVSIVLSSPKSTNMNNSSILLSEDKNNSLLKIPSNEMNIVDKPLTEDLINNLTKEKILNKESKVDKKVKPTSKVDNNSMDIDTQIDDLNNMNSEASLPSSNSLNLLQEYLKNDNDNSNYNYNNHTNIFSFLGNNINMSYYLQNPLLFNNTLSDLTKNDSNLKKNTSLLSDLTKSELIPESLSTQFSKNNEMLSNNLLFNLLCNNMNNQSLSLNSSLNSNHNLLNVPYNIFSMHNQNERAVNSLNNTLLQYLTNNNNLNNNINLNNTDRVTTNSESQSNSTSPNDSILTKENQNKVITTATINDEMVIDKLDLQKNNSGTNVDNKFLNNFFLKNNASTSNLGLLNLNPSTSDTKSSLDILSNNIIPTSDLKALKSEILQKENERKQ